MTLPKNFITSIYLAVALAGVAVITAAVGQTTQPGAHAPSIGPASARSLSPTLLRTKATGTRT